MTRNKNSKSNHRKSSSLNKNRPPLPIPPPPSSPSTVSGGNSFLGNMIQGFSFGTGSAVAHQVINAIFSDYFSDNNLQNVNREDDKNKICLDLFKMYQKCTEENFDKEHCKNLEGQVQQCMRLS